MFCIEGTAPELQVLDHLFFTDRIGGLAGITQVMPPKIIPAASSLFGRSVSILEVISPVASVNIQLIVDLPQEWELLPGIAAAKSSHITIFPNANKNISSYRSKNVK
jgi:hypothetical protein